MSENHQVNMRNGVKLLRYKVIRTPTIRTTIHNDIPFIVTFVTIQYKSIAMLGRKEMNCLLHFVFFSSFHTLSDVIRSPYIIYPTDNRTHNTLRQNLYKCSYSLLFPIRLVREKRFFLPWGQSSIFHK